MILSIKGQDLFTNWPVTLRSCRAHINLNCGFKLVSLAEREAAATAHTQPPRCQLLRRDLAGISSSHKQR